MIPKHDFLFNDSYKVLELIYFRQRCFDNECFAALTQSEIAENLGISKMTVSTIIKELKDKDLVETKNIKGRYYLTKEAIDLIKRINNMN